LPTPRLTPYADGAIRVHAAASAGEILLRVDDDGPGLRPEDAAQAFERFWRADESRVRATGGSGLGLAIVESIVAAHGGTIGMTSSVDAGTSITIRLPQAAATSVAGGPSPCG
jgi:signal transduction histidine kinase